MLGLQEADIEKLLTNKKSKGKEGHVSGDELALLTYRTEIQQHRAFHADRLIAHSLARAIGTDRPLITKHVKEESVAIADRALANELAGDTPQALHNLQVEEDRPPAGTPSPEEDTPPTKEDKAPAGENIPLANEDISSADDYAPPIDENISSADGGLLARLGSVYVPILFRKLSAFYYNATKTKVEHTEALDEDEDESDNETAESSSWAASRKHPTKPAETLCIACDVEKPAHDICQVPCGDKYCFECLKLLFELSTTDEQLFPPRCCQRLIPLASIQGHLSQKMLQAFDLKRIEHQTVDKTYCAQPICSAFILPASITGDQAKCATCKSLTCTICKKAAHKGDCPKDTVTQQVLGLAKDQKWQRCKRCGRVIQLDIGCNHIRFETSPIS